MDAANFDATAPVNDSPLPLPLPLLSPTCAFCRRHFSSDIHTPDLEPISVCGDCKFLFLEDIEVSSPDLRQMRSRRRYSSSDSIDTLFSHQFSQIITLARQSQPDNQSVDERVSVGLVQQSSSRTTPTGSRRFRRVFSDNDSDGFDSLYGETESIISFTRSRTLHGDADSISYSYSAYEGDSDASVDGQSILENEIFGHPNEGSDGLETDTDTDIDPMNVGYRWNSENEEEEEVGDNDSEWEETDFEGTPLESMTSVSQFHGLSRMNMRNANVHRQSLPHELERALPLGVQERIQPRADDLSTGFGESVTRRNRVGVSLDYLEARGFEYLLEHLSEADNSRRGAPPASASFVDAMPCLTIDEDNVNVMACAICKDSFVIGAVVKQLPCYHLYHPSCIYPWLSARNTCPLCRYELPTDDLNYEASKRSGSSESRTRDVNDDGTSFDDAAVDEPSQLGHMNARELVGAADSSGGVDSSDVPRNGWFFAAAAPIISILGMSLMLWIRTNRRCQIPYQRECNRSPRRWWRLHF